MNERVLELIDNSNANGGGLASNITGRFESNRHAIARIEKYTFGEVVVHLKKKANGGLKISASDLLEIYRTLFGDPEWHHAGRLPKRYGGGMAKTYFLSELPTAEEVLEWQSRYDAKIEEMKKEAELHIKKEKERIKFIEKKGVLFERLSEVPKFSVILKEEMHGRYGWFKARPSDYKLDIYYSGVSFKSKKTLDKYKNLFC